LLTVSSTESITDASSADGLSTPVAGINYIYAVHGTSSFLSWKYSSSVPAWSTPKSGWYNKNNRAVAVFYNNGGSYFGKRTLSDSRDDLIPTEIGEVTTGGIIVDSISGTQKKNIILEKGFYRIELAGSRGGNGGSDHSTALGDNGARRGYINTTVYINRTSNVGIFSAKQGSNGDGKKYTGSGAEVGLLDLYVLH
jgi:hypothetical protein